MTRIWEWRKRIGNESFCFGPAVVEVYMWLFKYRLAQPDDSQ